VAVVLNPATSWPPWWFPEGFRSSGLAPMSVKLIRLLTSS
jgi:hypothetical protein